MCEYTCKRVCGQEQLEVEEKIGRMTQGKYSQNFRTVYFLAPVVSLLLDEHDAAQSSCESPQKKLL